jgi:hypothetical protein
MGSRRNNCHSKDLFVTTREAALLYQIYAGNSKVSYREVAEYEDLAELPMNSRMKKVALLRHVVLNRSSLLSEHAAPTYRLNVPACKPAHRYARPPN